MKKLQEKYLVKKFYIHPLDEHTSNSIRSSFENWEGKYRFYQGSSVYFYVLTEEQVDFLEKSKALSDLKYFIVKSDERGNLEIWQHPKAKFSLTVSKAIGAIIKSKKSRKKNRIKVAFRNLNDRGVKLTKSDYIVYERPKKTMTFLKGGAEPLTYGGREGIIFENERKAIEYVENISAVINRDIEMTEYFDFLIFRIT